MKRINKLVVSYCDIPVELINEYATWLEDYPCDCFVEAHIDVSEGRNLLDDWFIDNYPGIENEDSFLIEMDY